MNTLIVLSILADGLMLPPLVVHILWVLASILVLGVIVYIIYLIATAIFPAQTPVITKVCYIVFLVCLLIIVLYAFMGH
jgi:hypothetical protein